MNYKRNEYVTLTEISVPNLKNYEKRGFMPGPVEGEDVDESVRRFTPFMILKTVLMRQIIEEHELDVRRAHRLIDHRFTGLELFALRDKIIKSEKTAPVILGFASEKVGSQEGVSIFGGYPADVIKAVKGEISENRLVSFFWLEVTKAYLDIKKRAESAGIEFEL